jgi:ComF family protein
VPFWRLGARAVSFGHTVGRAAGPALVAAAEGIVSACLAPGCAACRRVLDSPLKGPVCAGCWTDARAAAGTYAGALRNIIHAFKYEGRRSLSRPLAAILRERSAAALAGADCIVPVPLYPLRRLGRGFNQAAELARHLEVPVVHALWRVRPTAPQAGLTATGRARNVAGAFRLAPLLTARIRRTYVEDRVIVLVDDVMTTGATLRACAAALEPHRPREIRMLTLARAPLQKGGDRLPDVGGHGIAVTIGVDPDPSR